jgi:hypothetical protein
LGGIGGVKSSGFGKVNLKTRSAAEAVKKISDESDLGVSGFCKKEDVAREEEVG